METHPAFSTVSIGKLYRAILRLYPVSFRSRFGHEMSRVFEQALVEALCQGVLPAFGFLLREVLDAPACIAREHAACRAGGFAGPFQATHPRLWSSLIGALAFGAGFAMLGSTDVLRQAYTDGGPDWLALSGILCAGGFGGLGLGWIMDTRRKIQFALWGAVGFVVAQGLINNLYNVVFPEALTTPAMNGKDFLVAFLYPLGMGSVYGLFIGTASPHKKSRGRLVVAGGLALLAGFFVNRLSAALIQSYMLPALPGRFPPVEGAGLLVYFLVPCLLEGVFLGALLGSAAGRQGLASA